MTIFQNSRRYNGGERGPERKTSNVFRAKNRFKDRSTPRQRPVYLTPLQRLIHDREYDRVLHEFVQTKEMNRLSDRAYKNRKGHAIGKVNHEIILFVSGSRNLTDWVLNVADDFVPSNWQFISNHTAQKLTKLALKYKVDAVVGHSRGGMLVAKMDIPNYKKLGLDAAMRLAPSQRTGMMNLYQKQLLDKVISRRGTNQKSYKVQRPLNYHFLSRDNNQST